VNCSRRVLASACLIFLLCISNENAATADGKTGDPSQSFDIVVISGSSSGVAAAIGAARLGASVALVEPAPVLGGMLANGIGNVDEYSTQALSGVYKEFTEAVKKYYAPEMNTDPVFQHHLHPTLPAALLPPGTTPPNHFSSTEGVMDPDQGGRWEPHVGDAIFKKMVAVYPNIHVFYKRHAVHVIKEQQRVFGVVTCAATEPNAYAPCDQGTDLTFYGKVIIDATPEGDIAAWAGVPYRVGREARSPLEPHAGYIHYYNLTGEIMPGSTGERDDAVVSYGLRITVENYDEKDYPRHEIRTPPPGYNKADYEHGVYTGHEFNPHGKAEVNLYPFGSELEELNWSWPEASPAERERQYELFKNHALGFLYFLQHERKLRLGLPDDDYTDNGNVPYEVYVREARRIVGEYTLNESDILPFLTGRSRIQQIKEDAIAVAHDPLDSKPTHTKVELSSPDKGEGDFYINLVEPYQVPYRSILPKEIDGLLVPTAVSATHVAYSSVRLDPSWVVMGQAAGVAAAVAVRHGTEVRGVRIDEVQRELLKQKCELMFYWDLPLDHPAFSAVQWLSIKKVTEGYPDRLYRPDQDLTRAEMAPLIVNALQLWPTISDQHFSDVPPEFHFFREIETLYDNRALDTFGFTPLWPKYGDWDKHADPNEGYGQSFGFYEYHPEQPVTWDQFVNVIQAATKNRDTGRTKTDELDAGITTNQSAAAWGKDVLSRSTFGAGYPGLQIQPGKPITRGQAAALIAALLDHPDD
jgi:hypothetical protein